MGNLDNEEWGMENEILTDFFECRQRRGKCGAVVLETRPDFVSQVVTSSEVTALGTTPSVTLRVPVPSQREPFGVQMRLIGSLPEVRAAIPLGRAGWPKARLRESVIELH